jgi:hypothetical protein
VVEEMNICMVFLVVVVVNCNGMEEEVSTLVVVENDSNMVSLVVVVVNCNDR